MFPVRPLVVLLLLCLASSARAHLPGESSLVLSTDAENLSVLVSLSLPSAASLSDVGEPLSSATLDRHRPALIAAAPRVCTLVDAAGSALRPERVLVSVFEDHEVRFHLLFPADVRPARLRMPLLSGLLGEAFCTVSDLRQSPPSSGILTPRSLEHALAPSVP